MAGPRTTTAKQVERRNRAALASRKPISFDVSAEDSKLIRQIVKRAVPMYKKHIGDDLDTMSLTMDLEATAANGCPMRFADLLAADDFNFAHDVFGIMRHIDRTTGTLTNHFLPRFYDSKRGAV